MGKNHKMGKLSPILLLCCLLGTARPGLTGPGTQPAPEQNEDPAEEWKKACAQFEALKGYRPLFLKPKPISELLAWVPEGEVVQVFDEHCRPIELARHEGHLAGDTDIKTTFHKGTKRVQARTAHFGYSVSYTGPGWTDYEKDAKGRWQEVGGGGMGCFAPRPGVLNRVTRDAAWYSGSAVMLKVGCNWVEEYTSSCIGGGERVCRTCRSLQLDVLQGRIHHARGPVVRHGSSKPMDCSAPCPNNTLVGTRDRLNQYLAGKKFISRETFGDSPVLFRSRKACRLHRARNKKARREPSACP